ncbi:MAG: hypothetical protein HY741_16160 [Chloroflexi bacterium]|nr:hypothetical protein [Chloroflexota bacterium]
MILRFDLHLQEPKELFVFDPQKYDPFDEKALGEPGLDYLVARVIGFWLRAPQVRTRVFLPSEQMTPNVQDRLHRAMINWCDDLLVENRRERIEFFINNSIFFGIAFIVLAVVVWAQSVLALPIPIGDPELRDALNYGLDVVLWVAFWTPLSAFLLEWFPLYRR